MTLAQGSFTPPRGVEKRSYVRKMFSAIAPRYDLLNHLLSLNIDRLWRRRAVRVLNWEAVPDGRYLDLCAGTMDLAAELTRKARFRGSVVGADFAVPMLRHGIGKAKRAVHPVGADALELPFPAGRFDGCTVGFGVRNLSDLDHGLREMARVLAPGARLVILEFSTPRRWPARPLYLFYFQRVLPWVGRLVSHHRTAYEYLPSSVLDFPEPDAFVASMERAGFRNVEARKLTFGIAMLYVGVRT